jgi:hypothetical protein
MALNPSQRYTSQISHQSVCLYVYPPIVARQLLGKYVTAATNVYATIEELLDASFSMKCVSCQRKTVDWFFTAVATVTCSRWFITREFLIP